MWDLTVSDPDHCLSFNFTSWSIRQNLHLVAAVGWEIIPSSSPDPGKQSKVSLITLHRLRLQFCCVSNW